jgi:hypothetical protein
VRACGGSDRVVKFAERDFAPWRWAQLRESARERPEARMC